MKKLFSPLRTFVLALSMVMTILVNPSCKSTNAMPVVQSNDTTNFFQKSAEAQFRGEKVEVRDKDSVIIRERMVHDTVYITKEVYRDRLEARGEKLKAVKTDTVVVTEWREKIIEKPPRKYVPKFYKWCTGLLWAIVILAIGYWALKRWGAFTKLR